MYVVYYARWDPDLEINYILFYTSTRYVARYCQYWSLSELLVIKNNIKTIENKIESIMSIE